QGEGEKYRDRDLRSLKRQNPTEIVGFVSSLKRLRALFLFWVMANTQNLSHTDLPNNTSCYRLS
ncbi:hypothetical protein, partial [Yersinia enterocolitica]|uniref:hypothetical protein n=1 Tax=Yersinia enterocolitica TaxID=630 RepID=UPI0019CFC1D3